MNPKIFCSILLTLSLLLPCKVFADQDTLTQISTIDALLNGIYDGETSLKQLVGQGDFGIGTFQSLDGEMILMDGKIFQVTADGKVHVPEDNLKTPFAAVTFFEPDVLHKTLPDTEYKQLEQQLDTLLPTPNIFYGIKITGTFRKVKTRSVPKQQKPYPALKEVAKNQPVFEFENVKGTMIGFRCPPYVKGINVPGYHLHFLTKDQKGGGHVLNFTTENVQIAVDYTSRFSLILPEQDNFYSTDLSTDKSKELEKIEK